MNSDNNDRVESGVQRNPGLQDKYFERLREAAPVELYASGIDGGRCWWPWRMNKAGAEADHRHRRVCETYVIDSNFNDETVTNRDVLDEAVEYDANVAVLADVYLDEEATIDALTEGLEVAEGHAFDGALLLPLQPDHVACYEALVDVAPSDVWWGIGGLKDAEPRAKLAAARDLRAAVGPDAHIHGFGWGVTPELGAAVRSNPDLLDSIDNSTGVQNGMTEPVMAGKERMSVVAARAQANRIEALRELTPFVEEETPETLREEGQSGLTDAFAVADGGESL